MPRFKSSTYLRVSRPRRDLKLGSALILNQNPFFEMASKSKTLKYTLILLLVMAFSGRAEADFAIRFVEAARSQIGQTTFYDPRYQVLDYPNGDPPADRGVCTDVVIRALRDALNMDLQALVHEDMKANFSKYPRNWGLHSPDKNIDHRRVPNLQTFFRRRGWSLPISDEPENYKPGDMVTCLVPPHLPHIMIVSDKKNIAGIPYVIHNIGAGVQEEDRLFEFQLTGHYRIKGFAHGSSTDAINHASN